VSCPEAHHVLEAMFPRGIARPFDQEFTVGRWHCRTATPPVAGTAEVPASCTRLNSRVSASWRILSEA
jgi:hypothetical protein